MLYFVHFSFFRSYFVVIITTSSFFRLLVSYLFNCLHSLGIRKSILSVEID